MPRRTLARALSATSAALWLTLAATAPGADVPSGPTSAFQDPYKHLVLDSRAIAETAGVRLVLGKVDKDAHNPLFRADKPWEVYFTNLYPNLVYDHEEKLFKLWYRVNLPGKEAWSKMMPPGPSMHDVGFLLCYATSRDGIRWTKPELNLFGYAGTMKTNLVLRDCHNVGVLKDLHDPDPRRRYKLIHMNAAWRPVVRFSPDGLHWSEPVAAAGIDRGITVRMADTHNNAFWDALGQRYVMLTRLYPGQRVVARSQSEDFLHWTPATVALRSTAEEGKKHQAYCMPAFGYASCYLGLVMMYHAGTDRSVDCELAWSPDSVTWHRVRPGVPLIPRGPKGSYDAGTIYAQAGPPVLVDGRLRIYYGGCEKVHRGWDRSCLPCLATIRPDGFAAYEPADADHPGTVTTAPLVATGRSLRVTADAAGGSVRVDVLGPDGARLAEGRPIRVDVTDAEVAWKGGRTFGDLKGRKIRLKFVLSSAKLYAFSGAARE